MEEYQDSIHERIPYLEPVIQTSNLQTEMKSMTNGTTHQGMVLKK